MEKEAEYLSEWFVRYLQNRDLAFRKINNITTKDCLVIVEETSGKKITYQIIPFLDDFTEPLESANPDSAGIVTYNDPQAFDALKKSWKDLIKHPDLVIYFINPFSQESKRWIIRPRSHDLISDKESLGPGLKSLYETVAPITKQELLRIIS